MALCQNYGILAGMGAVVFSGKDWLMAAAILGGLGLLLAGWSYRGTALPAHWRWGCATLKALGLLALAGCLLEPLWTGHRVRPGANYFVMLADNSQGLRVTDRGARRSRGELLRQELTAAAPRWHTALERDFQVRRYLFDTRVRPTRDFQDLEFQGRATALGGALRNIRERYQHLPLAGVLLFTDGNPTDDFAAGNWTGLPPIYPVVLGNNHPLKDVSIQHVQVTQTVFEDAPVTIRVDAQAAGYGGTKIVAELRRLGAPAERKPAPGKSPPHEVVERQTMPATEGEPVVYRFQVRPPASGVHFYQVRVAAEGAFEQFARPEITAEATLANNSRLVVVDRGHDSKRVLYVAGRPNWEYKFLQRALADDPQVELTALVRIARREPKFEFRGRAGEQSNPLFRGFDRTTEETERYDQPVLLRLNTRDAEELSAGFPKTPAELYRYHAVILDDVEAAFFTPDQLSLLQQFVSFRGGGLLMLGGVDTFQNGKYLRTPVEEMLPVYLDEIAEPPPAGALAFQLTREGWLEPWVRLRSLQQEEQARLDSLPAAHIANSIRGVKPGARLLATCTDSAGGVHPALITQRYGNGRTAALTFGDLWRWQLHQEDQGRDAGKLWRQMIRWLVSDVPSQVELLAGPDPQDPGETLRAQVRVRNAGFQPLDDATVKLEIAPLRESLPPTNQTGATPQHTPSVRLASEPSPLESGLYEATYIPRTTGGYLLTSTVTDASNHELGRTQAGWAVDPAADEFRVLTPNRPLMDSLARQTGGRVLTLKDLDNFTAQLPQQTAPITETWTAPLWHRAGVFAFALACFVSEWGLRRWRGLP